MNPIITKARIIENSPVVLLARVLDATGDAIAQADVSSVSIKVFDTADGSAVGSPLSPSVASCVFDTLQTDDRWTADDTGYNVALSIAGSYFPTGDKTYQVEAKITPTSGTPYYLLWQLKTQNIYTE